MARNFDLQDEYKNRSVIIRRRAKTGPFDTSNAIDNKANMEAVINFQPVVPSSAEPNRLPIQLNNSGRVISGTNEVVSAGQNMETARLKTQAYLARNPIRATPVVPTATTQATATADTTATTTTDTTTGATTPNVPSTAPSLFDRAEEIKARMAFSRLPSRQQQAIRTQQRLAESSANQTAEFQTRMKANADEKAADTVREEKKLVLSQNADKRAEAEAAQKAEDKPMARRKQELEIQKAEIEAETLKQTAPESVVQAKADTILKNIKVENETQDMISRNETGLSRQEQMAQYQKSEDNKNKYKEEYDKTISDTLLIDKEGKIAPVSPSEIQQLVEKRLSVETDPLIQDNIRNNVTSKLDYLDKGLDPLINKAKRTQALYAGLERTPEQIQKEEDASERKIAIDNQKEIQTLSDSIASWRAEKLNIAEAKKLIADSKTVFKPQAVPQVPKVVTQAGIDTLAPGTTYRGADGSMQYKMADGETEDDARRKLGLPVRTQ